MSHMRGGGDGWAAGRDLESHHHWPLRRPGQDLLQQAQIIILKPNLAKIIGHFQDDTVAFKAVRPQGSKPKVKGVSAQHAAQLLLRCCPNSFSGSMHNYCPVWPIHTHFIHLAPLRARNTPMAALFPGEFLRRSGKTIVCCPIIIALIVCALRKCFTQNYLHTNPTPIARLTPTDTLRRFSKSHRGASF